MQVCPKPLAGCRIGGKDFGVQVTRRRNAGISTLVFGVQESLEEGMQEFAMARDTGLDEDFLGMQDQLKIGMQDWA
jgi:hypothetical protein